MLALSRSLLARRAFSKPIATNFAATQSTMSSIPLSRTLGRNFGTSPRRTAAEPDWTKVKDRRFLGLKWFPGMMVKPLYPFFIAGLIMIYAIDQFGKVLMDTEEFRDDPRNPRKRTKPSDH